MKPKINNYSNSNLLYNFKAVNSNDCIKDCNFGKKCC